MKFRSETLQGVKRKASQMLPYEHLQKKKQHLEKVIKHKYSQLEPKLLDWYAEVRQNAEKLGLPMSSLEHRLNDSWRLTCERLDKMTRFLPFREEQAPKRARKKPAVKKTPPRPATRKKTASKKVAGTENTGQQPT